MRIIQNQDHFSIPEYRSVTNTLRFELNSRSCSKWFKSFNNDGFIAGMLLYFFSFNYDAVVTVSHRPAMIYGIFGRIFIKSPAVHIAKELFFEKSSFERKNLCRRLISWLYKISLKYVDIVIVNATEEIDSYATLLELPTSRFCFIPWPSNVINPSVVSGHDGSILAVGRSLRDWETFFEAIGHIEQRCLVIASEADIVGLAIPKNVELFCDISHDRYLEFLKKAMVVVIPLKEASRSTGQASFLEAMAFGKPVIVANVIGARDYIEDRVNGILYAPKDTADLKRALQDLCNDSKFQLYIGLKGHESVSSIFNKRRYALKMLEIIEKEVAARVVKIDRG